MSATSVQSSLSKASGSEVWLCGATVVTEISCWEEGRAGQVEVSQTGGITRCHCRSVPPWAARAVRFRLGTLPDGVAWLTP
jgi:hypothetical protein